MSDTPSAIETMVEAGAEAFAEATAPIAEAVAASTDAVDAATKRTAKATRPRTRATKSPVKAAKVAKASATKPARTAKTTATTKTTATAKPTATAKLARRKYVRKATAAITQAAAPIIEGVNSMTDTNWFSNLTSTMPAMPAMPGSDKLQAMFGDVSVKSQDAVKKTQVFAEQMNEAAKANIEAVVESSKIAAAGARDLGTEIVASTKSSVEHAQGAVKTLVEAKSPTEFFQLQSDLVRASFDRFVAEGSKLTEQMVKLAGEAAQPLSNRASVNAEKFSELTSA